MKKENRSFKANKVVAVIFSLLFVLCLTVPSYSRVDSSEFRTEYQVVPGVSSDNNMAFAFGRYVLIAPFAPSIPVTETTSKEELSNHELYILDVKKVNSEPEKIDLGCYYPRKVYFDAETQSVYIKGTEIVENASTGEYEAISVLKYLRFNLPDNGKPTVNGAVQTIRIPGVTSQYAEDAPDDFIITSKYFIFHNGASILIFSKNEGYLYTVDFISKKDFDPVTNSITHLGFDKDSQVLTVLTNRKSEKEVGSGEWQHKSELYVYQLIQDGTVNLLTRLTTEAFPHNDFIPAGSSIAINWNGEANSEGYAYLPGASGTIYQTSWNLKEGSSLLGSVEPFIPSLSALQQSVGEYVSTVSLAYDKEGRTLEALRNGYTANIHRPANFRGRLGKIHRPANLRLNLEGPSLVLSQFSKKNKLVKQKIFTTELAEQEGILEPFADQEGNRYIASQKGNVFELKTGQIEDATLKLLGKLGNSLGSIGYFRDAFVAVDSCQLDENGQLVAEGSLLVAKRRETGNFLSFVNWTGASVLEHSVLGSGFCSIRRPCNTRP
jgi:hypothetical protein